MVIIKLEFKQTQYTNTSYVVKRFSGVKENVFLRMPSTAIVEWLEQNNIEYSFTYEQIMDSDDGPLIIIDYYYERVYLELKNEMDATAFVLAFGEHQ